MPHRDSVLLLEHIYQRRTDRAQFDAALHDKKLR